MAPSYIFRLDDICPTMNWDNFNKLEKIFSQFGVLPIIGIIPDNQDEKLMTRPAQSHFWEKMKELSLRGWIIAQHGYQHQYVNTSGGILQISQNSEFADLPYEKQFKKIKNGKEILEKNLGVKIEWWMAPSHSFDQNTCSALKSLGFKYITDGIALFPFQKYGLTWIPQQLWKPKRKLFGTWTICIHPNSITPEYLQKLEEFIARNKDNCKKSWIESSSGELFNFSYALWWKFQYLIYKTLFK